jgi:hypothetical protein
MTDRLFENAEPVPAPSQLAVLPFIAAVAGFLEADTEDRKLRVTMHRVINREGVGYLQQQCIYVGPTLGPQRHVGRIFHVTEGIIGKAYASKRILRTKKYSDLKKFYADLEKDMAKTGDTRTRSQVALSYIAIPFLGREDQIVSVLFADSFEFNFFADDERVRKLNAMCQSFCRVYDLLQDEPFAKLRNFPLNPGKPSVADPTVYETMQEGIEWAEPPRFKNIASFNYEASAA